jgi:hypothetical protein
MNAGTALNEWPGEPGQGPGSYANAPTYKWGSVTFGGPHGEYLNGISYERSKVSLRQVPDGTSNTYMVGERYIPAEHYETGEWGADNETWCTGFNNDNYRTSARLSGGNIIEATPRPDATSDTDGSGSFRFGSAHSSVWLVALCDGSVHALGYDIDWQVHRDLGNREDGNPVSPSGL